MVMAVVDGIMGAVPQSVPHHTALRSCRLISHRGEHDNRVIMENTLAAFEQARSAGVWGIECDIRWTRDLVPVICHDPSPQRLFGVTMPVAELTFNELRAHVPQIPSLQEVVDDFGGNTHLMLEIKTGHWPEPLQQADMLRALLDPLSQGSDYHLLALQTDLFDLVPFVQKRFCLPVAETNVAAMSRYALEQGCAGLGGHYLLLNRTVQQRHSAAGQRLGTGFPNSRNCLFRELNRGVEWVFSNDAVALQAELQAELDKILSR
jgi:glycerophosphoryl diester phosphodiesterase